MNITREMQRWERRVVGTMVRGQRVDGVSLEIDTIEGEVRFFVQVLFAANPSSATTDEGRLLQRVFNDIPKYAWAKLDSWRDVLRVLRGSLEPRWVLDDELPPQTTEVLYNAT